MLKLSRYSSFLIGIGQKKKGVSFIEIIYKYICDKYLGYWPGFDWHKNPYDMLQFSSAIRDLFPMKRRSPQLSMSCSFGSRVLSVRAELLIWAPFTQRNTPSAKPSWRPIHALSKGMTVSSFLRNYIRRPMSWITYNNVHYSPEHIRNQVFEVSLRGQLNCYSYGVSRIYGINPVARLRQECIREQKLTK